MLIYTGTKNSFSSDVVSGLIADKIQEKFKEHSFNHNNSSEYRSWENSLRCMQIVLNDNEINDDVNVAIEYQIPQTSKRVDFLITGRDDFNNDHVIIIELKQWEEAHKTSREDLVTTYLGGTNRATIHPSYQAYSYAKTIENFNETVEQESINLHPCAYLHNYKEEYRSEIDNYLYKNIIDAAPLYLKKDALKLREFIKRFIKTSDNGELLYKIENGRIRPSKVLQDSLSSMIKGNQEFVMIDEQKVVFSTIKKLVDNSIKKDEKYTVIVEGGPGTGKSVIAINLLAKLKHLLVNYVTKNAAPRNVYFDKLRKDKYKLTYIKNLFKGSGAYLNIPQNTFDCLLVDEAIIICCFSYS